MAPLAKKFPDPWSSPGVTNLFAIAGHCQLPLSKQAAQLFSHTMKPVKHEKIVHQQKQTTNESNN